MTAIESAARMLGPFVEVVKRSRGAPRYTSWLSAADHGAGLLALTNATDPAAASAASSEKPGTYDPVRSASTPATSGPRIMPNMTIIEDTPVMVPKEALPK